MSAELQRLIVHHNLDVIAVFVIAAVVLALPWRRRHEAVIVPFPVAEDSPRRSA
jgi:hypothetical protein